MGFSARVMVVMGIGLMVVVGQATAWAAGAEDDPFAGVTPGAPPPFQAQAPSCAERFFSDNFGFRWELMSEWGADDDGGLASRQSVGFEVLKKLSTQTRTVAGIDFQ